MLNNTLRAGAASRYGSGSDQMMWLLAAPAPQHWKKLFNVDIKMKKICYRIAYLEL
jgi:hypothetical protein